MDGHAGTVEAQALQNELNRSSTVLSAAGRIWLLSGLRITLDEIDSSPSIQEEHTPPEDASMRLEMRQGKNVLWDFIRA